jgi:hypothetical protein
MYLSIKFFLENLENLENDDDVMTIINKTKGIINSFFTKEQ